MSAHNTRRLSPGLCWIILLPSLLAQTPAKPGRLVVKSVPPGAAVVVNGQSWQQPTNTAIVVAPGNYSVSVAGDKLKNCPAKSVAVQSGSVIEITCTEAGWK